MLRVSAFVALGVALSGCHAKERVAEGALPGSAAPSAKPPPAPSADVDVPCAEFAKARCERLERLLPYDLALDYGTRGHCESRIQLLCLADARLPGLRLDADAIRTCAAAETDHSSPTLAFDMPLGCLTPAGTGAGNQPCIYDAQCSSGVCQIARGAKRGHCAVKPPGAVGDACEIDRCGGGLACVDGRCVAPSPGKDPCGDGPCGGTNKAGAACDPENPFPLSASSCAPGLVCASRRCVKPRLAEIGRPCEDGCRGARCVDEGICARYAQDGEACEFEYPRECEPPGRCFEGRCAVDPAPNPDL